MIGANSIVQKLTILNDSDRKHPFKVMLQANRNLGICDVILPGQPKAPVRPHDTSKKELVRAYNEAKKLYYSNMVDFNAKRSAILNYIKGQQINDPNVLDFAKSIIYLTLNEA